MYPETLRSIFLPNSPPSTYSAGPVERRNVPSFVDLPPKPLGSSYPYEASYLSAGLRTPPADDSMNAAYSNPVLSHTYDSHVALARQPNGLGQVGRTGRMAYEPTITQQQPYSRNIQQPQQQQHFLHQQQPQQTAVQTILHQETMPQIQTQVQTLLQPQVASQTTPYQAKPQASSSSRHSSRQNTPSSSFIAEVQFEGTVSRKESKMVTHSLDLPRCISPNGGQLDEFAAQMTCFFWFETMDTLKSAENIKTRRPSEPIPRLSQHTEPCPAYKKWVNGILSTTQVTQNVVLLALLFVYRLKKTNPKVNGNPGSEYRLLTVALMLGNKFLDDNTYTNKTWAEVSGISVKEIHVMEVEFLSNMRYGLLTSKDQWQDWLSKLACFHDYCERAKMEEFRRQVQVASSLNAVSPSHSRFTSPLPSPTSILPSSMSNATVSLNAFSPVSVNPAPIAQNWPGSYHPTPSVSPLAAKPSLGVARKRSLEGGSDLVEPAAKRMPRQPPMGMVARPNAMAPEAVRLPVPPLTLDTNPGGIPQPSYVQPINFVPQQQQPVSLPPLGPGMRAMATVYPPTTAVTTWAAQAPIMAPCGPQTPTGISASAYGTPTKRHSPGQMVAFASSPLADPYASHTPISNSPSIYLQQRASPYKPVRRVNTLLYPPPSMPLSEYHLGSSQMHYQPLGRRNDLRTGIVPDFLGSGQMRHLAHPPNQQHY